MYILLQNGLIFGSHPCFRQNFPLDKFYIYDTKMLTGCR